MINSMQVHVLVLKDFIWSTEKQHIFNISSHYQLYHGDLREMVNAIIFIYWPMLNDNFTSIPLQFSGVTTGHRSVAMGTGNTEENSPELRTVTPYAVSHSLSWVAHQVWKQEWEVVVYLIFLRVTRVACQLHSFSHSLFLFLSAA